jgi:hypothetical protein
MQAFKQKLNPGWTECERAVSKDAMACGCVEEPEYSPAGEHVGFTISPHVLEHKLKLRLS